MKLLTKHSDYALRALRFLAKNRGRFAASREISAAEKIPLRFLRRLLPVLAGAGIVESKEGARGGARLLRPAARINAAEIISLFQGQIRFSECMFRKKICVHRGTCALRKKIRQIEKKIVREFRTITVAGLLNAGR